MPSPLSAVAKADDWARQGSAAVDARDLETAKKCFSRAAKIDRGNAERRFHLAIVLEALEEYVAAAEQLTEALRIDPQLTQAARRFSSLLSRHILAGSARLNPLGLRAALQHQAVSRDTVADAALRYLSCRDPLGGALEHGRSKGWESSARNLCLKRTGPLLRDQLFLELLRTGVVKSPELEALLTALRRILVLEVPRQRFADSDLINFAVVLMQQCSVNEYVWMASAEELSAISERPVDFRRLLDGDVEEGFNFLLTSLYEPSYRRFDPTIGLQSIANVRPEALAESVARRVEQYIDEQSRVSRIARAEEFAGDTSRKVAAHYETAPYPRWTRLGLSLREGELRRSLQDYFRSGQLAFMDHPFEVLVAGCGTGMDAIQIALGYGPNVRVVALDLSITSLAYASRMADRFGARNIEFRQADIQRISADPEFLSRFPMIECGGVLHHMADPFEGWRSLIKCLKPAGIMRIGLYSSIARSNLTALRSDPAYPGAGCDDARLRAFRQLIMTRPDGQPGTELKGSPDFYSTSGFRDLALHVSETCLSIPEIAGFLEESRLVFRGFQPVVFFDLLREHHPRELWPGTLTRWAELELAMPILFAGMYKFWCEKL
jgi:SAM-dependent methyltransferase